MFVHIWLAASRYMYVATALSLLRATLRVDEKYAADLTPATYRTVSPRAGDSSLILATRSYFVLHATIEEKEEVQMSEQPRK